MPSESQDLQTRYPDVDRSEIAALLDKADSMQIAPSSNAFLARDPSGVLVLVLVTARAVSLVRRDTADRIGFAASGWDTGLVVSRGLITVGSDTDGKHSLVALPGPREQRFGQLEVEDWLPAAHAAYSLYRTVNGAWSRYQSRALTQPPKWQQVIPQRWVEVRDLIAEAADDMTDEDQVSLDLPDGANSLTFTGGEWLEDEQGASYILVMQPRPDDLTWFEGVPYLKTEDWHLDPSCENTLVLGAPTSRDVGELVCRAMMTWHLEPTNFVVSGSGPNVLALVDYLSNFIDGSTRPVVQRETTVRNSTVEDSPGAQDDKGLAETAAAPTPRLIRTWRDAEAVAAEWLDYLGFGPTRLTPEGADGGIDVYGPTMVAQVKMEGVPTRRPVVQALFGVAASRGSLTAVLFSLAGFTRDSVTWADANGVLLFTYNYQGEPVASSRAASAAWRRRYDEASLSADG